jgi:3-hydroxyacyl-[acyl-carrier-protein] dehydratase
MRWMWIDRIVELVPRERLVAIKNVSLAEEHLHDHFAATDSRPAMPIMPTSLIIEGLAQTAGILVGHAEAFREKVILAKISRFEITREATPGTTLRYTATLDQVLPQGAQTSAIVEILDHADPEAGFVRIGSIDLIFSHIDRNMAGAAFPEHNFVFGEGFKTLLRTSGIDV